MSIVIALSLTFSLPHDIPHLDVVGRRNDVSELNIAVSLINVIIHMLRLCRISIVLCKLHGWYCNLFSS